MADVKISELTALASASVDASGDVLAVVDTSATATRKITVENLLSPITINKATDVITDLGEVTTADINGGTWFGTIDGAWTAAGVTCANLGTVSAATSITSTAFVGDITGDLTGNADTVTNGVYTTGTQTISGAKTFSAVTTKLSSAAAQLWVGEANGGDAYADIYMGKGDSGDEVRFSKSAAGDLDILTNAATLHLDVDGSGYFSGGNFGIGKTAPSSQNSTATFLHIGGGGDASSGLVLEDNEAQWEIQNNGHLRIKRASTDVVEFDSGTGDATFAGDVNISDGEGMLHISNTAGTAKTWRFCAWDAGKFYISDDAGNTKPFVIDGGNNNIGIGTSSPDAPLHVEGQTQCRAPGAVSNPLVVYNTTSSTADQVIVNFYRTGSGFTGAIRTTGTATSYTSGSDYRLKENEVAISDGITRLKQLKPYQFNFKVDSDKTVDGFFAHEVSDIVPEAVSGEKDAVDENGDIDIQVMDNAKLVPLLVSALQEAVDRIEVLENA